MTKPIQISVLVPAYNCEKYITKCIDSLLNQSFKDIEIIVCDDGSTDNTLSILNSYNDSRLKILQNKKNRGNIKTMNTLFSMASGEYTALQDADDWSSLDRLEKQITFLNNNKNIDACFTQTYGTNELGETLFKTNYPLSHKKIKDKFPYHFLIDFASIMIRTKTLKKVGNYPEYFNETGAADWYWVYLLSENHKISNLEEALYFYRTNPNSISNKKILDYKKFFISDIIIFLIKQRKKDKKDGLSSEKHKIMLETYEKKLEKRYNSDILIHDKRAYVNAILNRNKIEQKRIFKKMLSKSFIKTISWFCTKPFSMLYNKIRISVSS